MAGLLTNGMLPGTPTFQTQQAFDPLADAKKRYVDGQGGTWSGDRYYTDQKDPTTGLSIVHDFSGLSGTAAGPQGGWSQSATDQYNAWQPADGVAKNISNYSIATGTALPAMGGGAAGSNTPADGDFSKPWTPAGQPSTGNVINSWDAYGQTPGQPVQQQANPYLPQSMQQQQVFTGGGSSQQANQVLAAGTPESYQAPAFNPPVTVQGAGPGPTEDDYTGVAQRQTALAHPTAAQVYLSNNPDVAAAYANLSDEKVKEWFGGNRPTAEQFAQTHFSAHGQREGRQWGYDIFGPGGPTGSGTAGTTNTGTGGMLGTGPGTTGTPSGMLGTNTSVQPAAVQPSSSAQYFQQYPELKAVWDGMTPAQKAEYGNNPDQFARTHYQKFGQQEGRKFGNPNAANQYFQLYPEVKAAWDALSQEERKAYGNNAEQFAWTHYLKFGKAEQRQNPWGDDGYSNNGSTYDARTERWNVTADQTVEGRLANLLDDDNPLVQMARTRGMQDAQARGLLNSSLGAQAGALAAYQYAMPIAQQDATTYSSAARQNASEQTNANLANANARTGRGNLEYSTQANIDQQNKVLASQQAHDKDMADISDTAQMDRLNRQIEATMQQNDKNIDANFRTSYRTQMGQLQSQYAQMYAAIQSSDMPADAKTAQLDQLDTFYDNYHVLIGNLFTSTGDMSKAFAAIPAPTHTPAA